jgi:protein-tyrosine phosphatase
MIDIHCHILPAIDDGPSDMEDSIRMAKMAAADGITHIAATPHFSYGLPPARKDIELSRSALEKRVNEERIPVTLLSGADIRLTYELMEGIETGDVPTINGSRYFLIELPSLMPPNLDNFIFTANLKGMAPIITHPERNYSLLESPEKIKHLRDSGALFQVTAMSITGRFGNQIRSFSHMLLKNGFVDFVASDAHSVTRRTPVLSETYVEVSQRFQEGLAERIFLKNPECVIGNKEITR